MREIVEIKRTLAGAEKRFVCQRLDGDDRHVVVLWVAPEAMHVHGVDLPPGTISFGHFWVDRPYNCYHWVDGGGASLGLYFNLADETTIDDRRICWRDLALDVLMLPDGRVELLDEDELPVDLDADTLAHVEAGKAALLTRPGAVAAEIEAASRALFGLVFPARG